ncbi:MAG: outer membrane beta-barrel protein [Candidatus Eisenbacteria bacterium]|nr:outer membrane beta-barrel protein [Candidatus Eisenbacteria bacterium]
MPTGSGSMKRQALDAAAVLALVAAVLLISGTAFAQDPPAAARRGNRYGRVGSEIWIEAPRVTFATGGGYRNGAGLNDDYAVDIDLGTGVGFGFGIFFAISDNLLFEGRMLQSTHSVGALGDTPERNWDLDQAFVGVRYIFRYDEPIQPSIGVGGLRNSLEWDPGADDPGEFIRLTGFGGYASFGLDYIISRRWVLLFRAEYAIMSYGNALYGTDDIELDSSLEGNDLGVSIGLSYRIPMW